MSNRAKFTARGFRMVGSVQCLLPKHTLKNILCQNQLQASLLYTEAKTVVKSRDPRFVWCQQQQRGCSGVKLDAGRISAPPTKRTAPPRSGAKRRSKPDRETLTSDSAEKGVNKPEEPRRAPSRARTLQLPHAGAEEKKKGKKKRGQMFGEEGYSPAAVLARRAGLHFFLLFCQRPAVCA